MGVHICTCDDFHRIEGYLGATVKSWDEFRTAYYVAKQGSISGAAKALSVHRATVLRHIDALEQDLGTKVFIRERDGYRLTEVGEDLLRVAKITDEQLTEFSRRSVGQDTDLEGDFTITALEAFSDLLMPVLHEFKKRYPKIRIRFLSSAELIKLEYGQAHIAIRSGAKPTDDNYVVRPFLALKIGLFASESYIESMGSPKNVDEFSDHHFVGADSVAPQRPEFYQWLEQHVPRPNFTLLTNSNSSYDCAIKAGFGIGFVLEQEAEKLGLQPILPDKTWQIPNWLVTHGDMHHSNKVQSFLSLLREDQFSQQIQRKLGL